MGVFQKRARHALGELRIASTPAEKHPVILRNQVHLALVAPLAPLPVHQAQHAERGRNIDVSLVNQPHQPFHGGFGVTTCSCRICSPMNLEHMDKWRSSLTSKKDHTTDATRSLEKASIVWCMVVVLDAAARTSSNGSILGMVFVGSIVFG